MKKIIALILCILTLISLCGCQTQPAETQPQLQEIKNIILIIGDGFGLGHMAAAEIATGKDAPYHNWVSSRSDTTNVVNAVTDSAAGATALATGTLTKSRVVGQDRNGQDLKTILDYASEKGKSTGIITTDGIAGATPAAFSTHNGSRDNFDEIMIGQFTSGIDLLCAQQTSSALDLCDNATYNSSYTVCKDLASAEANMSADNVYWQLPLDEDLTMAIDPALRYLSQDDDGFVLMIEQAHIDKYADDNDFEGTLTCVNDLNEAVENLLAWVGNRKDTAIILTADHETGYLEVSDKPDFPNSYTSPQGNTVYYFFGTTQHTAQPVGVFTYGFAPNFEKYYLDGSDSVIKNTSVFLIMKDLLDNPMQ